MLDEAHDEEHDDDDYNYEDDADNDDDDDVENRNVNGNEGPRMNGEEEQRQEKEEDRETRRIRRIFEEQHSRLMNEQSANLLARIFPPLASWRAAPEYGDAPTGYHYARTPQAQPQISTASSSSSSNEPIDRAKAPSVELSKLETFLGPRLNFGFTICKALSLPPSLYGMGYCLYQAWLLQGSTADASARSLELVLAALWCTVSAYLSYAFIDGLMLRWLVMYSLPATILRLLSINTLMGALTRLIVGACAGRDQANLLPTWIVIACILTTAYAIQTFVTSNIAIEQRARRVDLYRIVVFAVVPVGFMSFVTMLGLIRSLVLIRAIAAS
ncbi:N-glycosylation protein-domain-containing protein [Lipomyces japonicus]|uniref:N-glycosylation protein-domain-containing protein n=1 Tax=Lipomyces japonicus TaxID=56871 RepID=UPI0034CE24E0